MWFLLAGLVLLGLKLAGVQPVSGWGWDSHWWVFAAPFALAALWWLFCDLTGLTRRQAMARDDGRRENRRMKQREALGQPARKKR